MTREEAIEVFKTEHPYNPKRKDNDLHTLATAFDLAISALSENKGEWIKIQSGDKDFPESIVCSKCKNENSHLDFNEHGEPIGKVFVTSKFCPNCGADMREPKGKKIRCNTCKNNDDELSGKCYECVKNIQNHYEPKESED